MPRAVSPIALSFRKWRQHLANRGFSATFMAMARACLRLPEKELAAELWRDYPDTPSPHPFDARHGTDTGGLIWGEQLTSGHRHDVWNTAYYGVPVSVFRAALASLSSGTSRKWHEGTFIDLGSGKGRAVLLANEAGFGRAIGVELSPDLHAIALKNRAVFSGGRASIGHMELLNADAAEFPWDLKLSGPLIFLLYNPFSKPVLAKFLGALKAFLRSDRGRDARPPEVLLLYINPELDDFLGRQVWIERIWIENFSIEPVERLEDRFGSTEEIVAAYRCDVHSIAAHNDKEGP